MKNILMLFLISSLFISCEEEDSLTLEQSCSEDYFYYSDNGEINLNLSLSEIWIKFAGDTVSRDYAENILGQYEFIELKKGGGDENYHQVKATFNIESDCTAVKKLLVALNENPEIFSATPVFSLQDDISNDFYMILLSEILIMPKEEIPSSEFLKLTENFDVDFIENNFGYRLRVKNVITGFESLEIANELYESGKVLYSHPNFIAPISLY